VFAVEMTGAPAHASFRGLRSGTATVLDESRTIQITNGAFEDDFDAWGVHLYRITP
jgi:hypothetical protein